MISLIETYLNKLKIDTTELTEEEQATLDQWSEIFTNQIDVSKIATFLETEIARLHNEIKEAVIKKDDRAALFLTGRVKNYEAIIGLIRQPEAERERLKARIESLAGDL